eukprot:jgi/Tetstr1/444309/TSEL_032200.t1
MAAGGAKTHDARRLRGTRDQLDPRYCKGNLFKLMLGTHEEARELMKEYDAKSLLSALVHLSGYMQIKTDAAGGPSEQVAAAPDDDDDDDDGDAHYYDDGDKNLDLDAKVRELLASYYGEATFSAVTADLLKPCGEDWPANQVLEGEGEGEASRIQWEAVESMLEQYGAEPADEEAGV